MWVLHCKGIAVANSPNRRAKAKRNNSMAKKRQVIRRYVDATEPQWQVNMRTRIMIASSSLLVRAVEKIPETTGMKNVIHLVGIASIPNELMQQSGEPVPEEVKSRPTIHNYLVVTLTGDNLNRNARVNELCVMPKGDKSQAYKSKRDDTEYPTRLRSVHSSLRRLITFTWRRNAIDMHQYQNRLGRKAS